MYRSAGEDHYRPVSWDDAFDVVAGALEEAGDPNRAVFYTSGRTSNEAAFLYQLFVRRLGTNNLPDCSNMCHESSGEALGQTIGIGKGSVTLDDIYAADLIIVVMGQNPGTNHPRMLTALERAKANGGAIVAVNPLREAGLLRFKNPQRPSGVLGRGTELADEYLQVKLGADLALFQYVNRRMVELDRERGGVLDHEFLNRSVAGADELLAHLDTLDLDALLAATGLERDEVERLVNLVATKERIIICWAMGITQHRQAVATIREMVNTLLLRGSIGKAGAGVCPVRGHSNVQGDRTMGIFERMPDSFLDALGAEFSFEPPREHGFDTVKAIQAMQRGDVDVFFAMGGNFLMAAPRHSGHRQGHNQLQAHRAGEYQAQPFSSGGWPVVADPAHVRPHRPRSHRGSGAEGDRGGFHDHGPCLGRVFGAAIAGASQRGRHRVRSGSADAWRWGRYRLGIVCGRLRPHP